MTTMPKPMASLEERNALEADALQAPSYTG